MQNAQFDESQAETKTAGRNIINHTYADDTTLMAESEEELKSLLMKVKEESEKAGLKGKSRTSDRFHYLGLQNLCRQWLQLCH